jgi:hypothetical protein
VITHLSSLRMNASWVGLGLFLGLGLALGAGCGLAGALNDHAVGGEGDYGGAGGGISQGGGDAGIDANLGDADPDSGPLTYAELCGNGCVPSADPDAGGCAQGTGGGGGGPSDMGGCRLEYDSNSESVQGACGPVGTLPEESPCFATADCALGLACVGAGAGACRPLCCADLEACPEGTYCTKEPLVTGEPNAPNGDSAVQVPVCVLATQCTLLDDTTCPDNQTCTIVRVDGTTSCVDPGSGELGQACPCAAGFVCATGINQCMKLCRIGQSGGCPEAYTCQGGATVYPEGFGVCVDTRR